MTLVSEAPPSAPGPSPSTEPVPEPVSPDRVPRDVLGVISAVMFAVVLVQRWGLLTHDSRLDLLLDPQGFLSAIWNLWDPTADMGRIQNQAVGYLFPMGPVMLLGNLLHIPPWIVERVWIAFLLIAAMWGMVRLLEALRVGSAPARVLSSLSFVLAPFFIVRAGNVSIFVQGAAFLPWMLLPLVKGSREGSPRRAAAASGLAVLFMGGVNAVVVAGALVPGVIWLITRQRGPRRAALMRWWILAVVLATAWWTVPLAYQGRFGIDFLTFTERAATTTSTTPPFEVLRGVADWLSYYPTRGASLIAGSIETTAGLVVAAGALVVAIGLYGLARRGTPERRFLVLTLLAGTVLVGAGFGGSLGNPFGSEVVRLLDGPLGLFRNVYKFAPVVLLPVAVGVAAGIDGLTAGVRRLRPSAGPILGRAVLAGVALLVVLGAWPLFGGDLLNQHPFAAVPSWWDQAKDYVQDTPGRTLIVPGLPLSSSTWGFTAEEPFEWGTSAEWAVRQIAPLGSSGATRVLDTVEATIEKGGSPDLAAYLRRAGFSTVLLRNDGDWASSGAPSPLQTTLAVQASGLVPVASFGPAAPASTEVGLSNLLVHPIDIYEVPDTASMQPVSTTTVADSALVSGDAGTPLDLVGTPLEDRSVLLAADYRDGDPLPPTWLVTDGNQRTFTSFGLNRLNRSYVLSGDEPAPGGGDVGRGLLPTDRVEDQTVAVRTGVSEVTASSYGSWPVAVPEAGPQQAIDGDPTTAWTAAGAFDPETQWIQLRLDDPTDVGEIQVQVLADGPWRPVVRALEVTTDSGSVTSEVRADESVQSVVVPPGPMSWLRIRFADVDAGNSSTGPGLREITIPGVAVDQRLAVPEQFNAVFSDPDRTPPSYLFTRSTVDPYSLLRGDAETELRRTWNQPQATETDVSVQVSAIRGAALPHFLGANIGSRVSASSTLGDLPNFSPSNLIDGDPVTFWAAGQEPRPTVVLEWADPRTLGELHLVGVGQYSNPTSVHVVTDQGEVRDAPVEGDGTARFAPLTAHRFEVTFPTVARYVDRGADGLEAERPVALAELSTPDAPAPGRLPADAAVTVPCGSGPTVSIDGRVLETSIETTVAAVESLRSIPARVCDPASLDLATGRHTLDTARSDLFAVRSVWLEPAGAPLSATPVERTVDVERWTAEDRQVAVGPGDDAFLAVAENANAGWRATLDGQRLEHVTLDGWKQGFVVPAGDGGVVSLTYAPTSGYRVALVAGALLAIGLLFMLLVPARKLDHPAVGPGHPSYWLLALLVIGAGVAIGGPLALLLVPIFLLGRWRAWALPFLAGASFVVAGVVVGATQTDLRQDEWGASGWVATVLSVTALLAVAATLLFPTADRVDPDGSVPEQMEPTNTGRLGRSGGIDP